MDTTPWPHWSPTLIKAGFPASSLLAGTEPAVWAALGRLSLRDFQNGKQVTLRKALQDIGLGWVATNNTPFRIAIGGLFDAAKRCHEHGLLTENSGIISGYPVLAIQIETRQLPEAEAALSGPLKQATVTEATRCHLWQQLEACGAYVIRRAMADPALARIPDSSEIKQTKLAETMGNGMAGDPPAVYQSLNQLPEWHHQLQNNLGKLLIGAGAPEKFCDLPTTLRRRSILLMAGEGAENWAHQDNNSETLPLQALLMLSQPQVDFRGGEFYIARQTKRTGTEINIVRHTVAFESPGDLVIFQAGKDSGWWHGMLTVKPGECSKPTGSYLRKALGMLQPVIVSDTSDSANPEYP